MGDHLAGYPLRFSARHAVISRLAGCGQPSQILEIDWIELTGVEELAQGELSPQDIAAGIGPLGTLFAEPDFFPLGEGIGSSLYMPRKAQWAT